MNRVGVLPGRVVSCSWIERDDYEFDTVESHVDNVSRYK